MPLGGAPTMVRCTNLAGRNDTVRWSNKLSDPPTSKNGSKCSRSSNSQWRYPLPSPDSGSCSDWAEIDERCPSKSWFVAKSDFQVWTGLVPSHLLPLLSIPFGGIFMESIIFSQTSHTIPTWLVAYCFTNSNTTPLRACTQEALPLVTIIWMGRPRGHRQAPNNSWGTLIHTSTHTHTHLSSIITNSLYAYDECIL